MRTAVVWHGTEQESLDLVQALARNCTCAVDSSGVRISTCPPHVMLVEDQRALDGLVCERRRRAELQRQEWMFLWEPE